jgi:VWFA-related protein
VNRFSRLTAVVTALTIAAAPAFAQQQQQQQQPEIPKLIENIDVRVINVDVVVTDRKGVPITGLTKDDFEIYENGQPKVLTNFYEVVGQKAVNAAIIPAEGQKAQEAVKAQKEEIPEQMRRRVIFFIDNLSLAPFNRNRVFTQIKEFAKNVLRPGDEAMVATYNRSLKVRAPFTRDLTTINQTLDSLAGESSFGLSNKSEARDVRSRIHDAQSYDEAIADARSYAESVMHDLRTSVESINGLMATLAGVEGKKVLVLTSEGFFIQPGRDAFQMVEETAKEKGWSSSSMLEGMSYDGSRYIESVAKTANANGITLYTLHAAGLSAGQEGYLAEESKPTPFSVTNAAVTNSTESLQLLAEMTGGLATTNTNNFAQAFKNIERDLDSYYSLGYRAGTERVDRQRSLQVRVKNKNWQVRNRQTFVEKSQFAEMSDRVIANLLYKVKANDLKVRVKTNPPVPQDDLFRVPVEIQIPMDSLTLLPQGESYTGGFSIYIAVANKDGDMSDVTRKTQQVRVPQSDMKTIAGKYYTFSVDLLMEKGVNRISVGVVDDVTNQTGFERVQVIAQDLR